MAFVGKDYNIKVVIEGFTDYTDGEFEAELTPLLNAHIAAIRARMKSQAIKIHFTSLSMHYQIPGGASIDETLI